MSIITLTTDLGHTDQYVAQIKANIITQSPNTRIIDISHQVQKYNIQHASYILKNCYKEFPPKTIHFIGVNSGENTNKAIAVYADNHYFISFDNGIFSLLLDKIPDEIVNIKTPNNTNYKNFPEKDIFVNAACHISRGGKLEVIGEKIQDFEIKKSSIKVAFEQNVIRGTVIHIDSYGNAITNIDLNTFKSIGKQRPFSIYIGNNTEINKIHSTYNDVEKGEILAFFIKNQLLQISQNQGSAENLIVRLGDMIRVDFNKKHNV